MSKLSGIIKACEGIPIVQWWFFPRSYVKYYDELSWTNSYSSVTFKSYLITFQFKLLILQTIKKILLCIPRVKFFKNSKFSTEFLWFLKMKDFYGIFKNYRWILRTISKNIFVDFFLHFYSHSFNMEIYFKTITKSKHLLVSFFWGCQANDSLLIFFYMSCTNLFMAYYIRALFV